MLGTDPLTGAAAGAFNLVHHGKPLGSHDDRVEGAGGGAGAQPEAADIAHLHATGEQGDGPAVVHAVIAVFDVRVGHAVGAPGQGDVRLLGLDAHAEDGGNGQGHVFTGGHARVGCGFARHDGFRIGAASRQAAAAAVGSGQGLFDGNDFGVHVNVKDLGGQRQADAHHQPQSAHEYNGYRHLNAPVKK